MPLLLQHRYDPDGWLGIIKGNKLHFDFSVEAKFEPSLQGLLKEIAVIGQCDVIECRVKIKRWLVVQSHTSPVRSALISACVTSSCVP